MLQQRLLSAIVLVPPLALVLLLGEPWIVTLVAVVTLGAAIETIRLLRSAGYPALAPLGAALAVLVAVTESALPGFAGAAALLVAIGLGLTAAGALARPDPRDGLAAWMTTVFGALYASQLGFVVRLGQLAPGLPAGAPLGGLGPERAWILLLVLGVWSYDTGAYVVGRRFGRSRFLVHISPSKTYAGLVGGLVAATAVVAALLWAVGQPVVGAIVLGPLLGLAAQVGDLAESMLKRAAGAKDSGSLIPGHGGILDRVDSFLIAAPTVTLYVVAVVR